MNQNAVEINDQDIYEDAAAVAIEEMELPESLEQIEASDEQVEQEEDEQSDGGDQEIEVTLTLEQIVDQVLDATWKSQPTLYTISTALNGVLEVLEATKVNPKTGKIEDYRVRSQMMYQYNSNKLIAKNAQGKGVKIDGAPTRDQARSFIIRFSAKYVN